MRHLPGIKERLQALYVLFLVILFWNGRNVGQMKSLESEPNLTEERGEVARQE